MPTRSLLAFAFFPVFAACAATVVPSRWTDTRGEPLTRDTAYPVLRGQVRAVAVAPSNPSIVILAGSFGLGRSEDGGASWRLLSELSSVRDQGIAALAIAAENADRIYAAKPAIAGFATDPAQGYGLRRSDDGGRTWTNISAGLPGLELRFLAPDPKRADRLYVTVDGKGVFRSDDAGGRWVKASAGLEHPYFSSLTLDPSTPDLLYVSNTSSQLFRSEDGGASWRELTEAPRLGLTGCLSADGERLLLGNRDGLYVSADGGARWSRLGPEFEGRSLRQVFSAGPRELLVVAAATGGGATELWRSSDGAESFEELSERSPPGLRLSAIAAGPGLAALYSEGIPGGPGQKSGLYKSVDGGRTWTNTYYGAPEAGGQP